MTPSLALPTWRFVPADLDAGDPDQLEPLFAELLARDLSTVAALERWLLDESELRSRIRAEEARRYVAMTCHTDDEKRRQAHLDMEQKVLPRAKVLGDRLDRQFLAAGALGQLDAARYGVLIRQRRTQSAIFRVENTELQRQEAELQTNYQGIVGGITVEFEGRTHTLQQMAPYFESQDRALRERAYRASLDRRRAAWPALEGTFDQLVALRHRMAQNAGFASYTQFRFLELCRFDYTAETCLQLHDAVEKCVVPAVRELDRRRAERLGVTTLRPWDLEVDPDGRPPLRPFATEGELIDIAGRVFAQVDPRFRGEFETLVQNGLLDLMSRKGKAPGGYQYQLEDVRLPFIFANSVGLHGDVQTLLHEGGHAFHSLLCRDHDLLAFRDYPIEFAETASMSMELLGLEHLDGVYAPADARAARRKHLEGVLRILTWIASIDAFQHWLYAHPQHSHAERRAEWRRIRARFAPHLDWSGLDDALEMQWVGQVHLFNHAFYYVEYAIAQIAALQIWRAYRSDRKGAVEAYRRALALGGSRPLPELFATAGAPFDLSAGRLRTVVDDVLAKILAGG